MASYVASLPLEHEPTLDWDVERVRQDFPALDQEVHGKPLVYLDNAATAQTPQQVINSFCSACTFKRANIHRAVHALGERATKSYEDARLKIQRFLGAKSYKEIIFLRSTTEAINLVAQTYGRKHVGPGDEIVLSALEHHSNIVPWQLLCEEKGAKIRVIPVSDDGEIDLEAYSALLSEKTKLVAVTHVSNALGSHTPVQPIIQQAHALGIPVLLDGAQGVPHMPVDVQELDCDFYAFSGHKLYGPTGIGVLYGKADVLETMPPFLGGGDMIRSVTFEKTVFNDLPHRFEAGTPNIAGAIGLGATVDYLESIGMTRAMAYEQELATYTRAALSDIPGLRILGPKDSDTTVFSFVLDDIHPHDIATMLDLEGIAVRAGHHCAQPTMERFKVPATTRASLGIYNTRREIDALVAGIHKIRKVFSR